MADSALKEEIEAGTTLKDGGRVDGSTAAQTRDMTMVGVERFDKSKLQTADQPKQSLAKSKDMTLVGVERFNKDNLRKISCLVEKSVLPTVADIQAEKELEVVKE